MIDRTLLNAGFAGSTWGNLGLWTDAVQSYPAACEALAVRLGERAALQPGCSVLDVGFGYGDQLLVWKQRFGVGHITGLEVDAKGVAEARRKLAVCKDVALSVGDASQLPPAPRFDRVLALDCAYHFAPRSGFFAQAFLALQPGGRLALTDLLLADSASAAQHARLARVCGIPPENLLTQHAYAQALEALGFCNVRFDTLDDAVLQGFTRFALRLLRQSGVAGLSAGGLKIAATAAIAAWLRRGQRVHYMLVSADRP